MTEQQIQNDIRRECNTGDARLWRNNIGTSITKRGVIHYGIPGKGGSDLIGFKTVTITPEHIGKKVAIFLAIECKSATGKPSTEQTNFIEYVRKCGGLAGIARSADEANQILNTP
jgi:hypothetical protein